jgi:hypothetical protein
LGTNTEIEADIDDVPKAGKALVFLAVSLKEKFKIPVGYFLVSSLTAVEQGNLVKTCLGHLYDCNTHVHSITFDGLVTNLSMARQLGANLEYGENFNPSFPHPCTKKPVFIFLDPSHCLKNVRNAWAEVGPFYDSEGRVISWDFIEYLVQVEEAEGRKLATRLRRTHLNYKDNKMNVRLAAQVLSNSVYAALTLLQKKDEHNEVSKYFQYCEGTAEFCQKFDLIFDMLNCRYRYPKSNKTHEIPLTEENRTFLRNEANTFINYIATLTGKDGDLLITSRRKTGFLGFIICLENLFNLYDSLNTIPGYSQEYLLSYKLSQDHLETLFSVVRSCGGFNNNPNALQFRSAYKRLLVRHGIEASVRGNCQPNDVPILTVPSTSAVHATDVPVLEGVGEYDFLHEYLYYEDDMQVQHEFDAPDDDDTGETGNISDNITAYIGGFIVHCLQDKFKCCKEILIEQDENMRNHPRNDLIRLKSRGRLSYPSTAIFSLCSSAERIFLKDVNHLCSNTFRDNLVNKIVATHSESFFQQVMLMPCFQNEQHRYKLLNAVAKKYARVRIFHELKRLSERKEKNIRRVFSKLIHFKHF